MEQTTTNQGATAMTPKFRKIYTGLYGTGITRTAESEFTGEDTTVELVIDKMDGEWWHREVEIDKGMFVFRQHLGECYPTLTAAKAAVSDRPLAYA